MGLLLTAATLYTIYYYYPLASIEIILVGTGIILIGVAYGAARYLAVPRFGIINSVSSDLPLRGLEQLESLIIAESFHDHPAAGSDDITFGGGTAGGGGASGQYWLTHRTADAGFRSLYECPILRQYQLPTPAHRYIPLSFWAHLHVQTVVF